MFKELEIVELTHDILEYSLKEGDRGTVVEVYKDGEAYEVEFIDTQDKASLLLTLSPEDLRPIYNKDIHISHELGMPIYTSTATDSGFVIIGVPRNIFGDFTKTYLPIKTEKHKNKANTEEFYYSSLSI